MRLIVKTLRLLILLSIGLTTIGCANNIIFYPISKTDIFYIPVGTKVGDIVSVKSGWFLSDDYIKEITKIKINTKK